MGLSKIILRIVLKILDALTFFIKQDSNRITFVSLTQDHLSSDFKLIDEQLRNKSFDIHYNLIVFEQNIKGKLGYFFNCMKQLIDLKKSKLIILNDNNYVVSYFKPENTIVMQIWHAPGAVKKFGNQIQRQYPIQNYDYVICNSPYWKKCYSEAFHVKEDQVIVTGLPRMDMLINKEEIHFYEKYPQCRNKRLILYAPTFRGNIIDGFKMECIHFDSLKLEENEMILCKFHPLLQDVQIHQNNVLNVSHEDLYELMKVSDCMISDYSSVIFDYCLLNKEMIGFVPDYDTYKQTIGFNIDFYQDFPGPVCQSEEELNKVLHKSISIHPEFQKKYVSFKDGNNTKRVVELICEIMKSKDGE